MKNYKGFTLVEVLVTITVLGIVTLLTLPVISAVSSQLNNKKLNVYENTIESGAKIYADAHDLDLFGYQTVGCVDIYYNTLVSNKVIDELDFSNQDVMVDKIFVRVKKVNDNYSYETFFPTSDNIADIKFNLCEGSISDSGPRITFLPNDTNWKKNATATINIDDMFGISPNAKIKYQWFYVDGTPIGTAVTHNFKNSVVESLSLNVDTPTGLNAIIKLVVTPIDLTNEISMPSTDVVQSDEFKLDNTAPVVNIDAYQESGGNRTGGVLASGNNSNVTINGWTKFGYYFDFTRSTDNVGITKEVWSWNQSGKTSLDTTLNGGSGTFNTITNHTLTASGVRYGSIKLCDEAGNCTTKTVQVSVSSIYTINYDANGGSGSSDSTTCYYGYDCNLVDSSGFSRTGHTFNKWNIDGTNYDAGGSVKNLTFENKVYTAKVNWNVNSHTVYYNVRDNNWHTKTVSYGSDIDLDPNPQDDIGDKYRFHGWKGSPGTMPDYDVTLYADIRDINCGIMTGYQTESHVNSFIQYFNQKEYYNTHIVDTPWAPDYKHVTTDWDMSYWRAWEVANYVWDHTPSTRDSLYLVYMEVQCDNGHSYPKCRAWASC